MARALKWLAIAIGSLIALLAVAIVGGYFYLSANIDHYTPRIERMAARRLGEPVDIGSIALSWHGFGVEIRVRDLAVRDARTRHSVIAADRVRVDLNPLNFLGWPQVHPAFIGIRAPRFTVVRQADGSVTIPGLPSGGGARPSLNEIVTFLSKIGKIEVDDGTITFESPKNAIKDWRFRHLDARITGSAHAPRLSVSMDLPKPLGRHLGANLELARVQSGGRQWHWHGQLRLAALKLASVPKLLPSVPVRPHAGRVNLRLAGNGTGLKPEAARGKVRPVKGNSATAGSLTADLDWHAGAGGKLDLRGANLAIVLHGLFRGPLALDHGSMPLTFKHERAGWRLESDDFKLANADLTTGGRFSVLLPDDGGAPRLDVKAHAEDIDLKHRSRYLPVGIMPPEVTAWVDRSVKSGRVPHVEVVFRGAADDFPFYHGEGLFKVDFDLRDARIKFDPEWPAVHKLNARIVFKNEGLSAKVTSGTIKGMKIAGSEATIADLAKGRLQIAGNARGDAAQAMDFLRASPIAEQFGPYITKTAASGKLDVNTQLDLPLADMDRFRIHGQAHLHKVNVKLADFKEGFKNLAGELDFAKVGLSSPTGLTGEFLGAPVAISVKHAPGQREATQIEMDADTTAAAMTQALGVPADLADGDFHWHARVLLPNEFGATQAPPLSVHVQSDLKGLGLSLPAPFAKSKSESIATTATFKILNDGFAIDASYGDKVWAKLALGNAAHGTSIQSGVIHFGAGQPGAPKKGLLINGHLARVSLAKWRKMGALFGGGTSARTSTTSALPSSLDVDLSIGEVDALGQHFHKVGIEAHDTSAGYRARLTGPDIAGTASLPAKPDNEHPYRVSLDRLHLEPRFPSSEAKSVQFSPLKLPPVRFSGKDLRLGKRHLGTLRFKLLKAPGGVVLPWLSLTQPALKVNVYGTWVIENDIQHTRLTASARSDDVKAAFKALGLPAALTAKKARINAELGWPGPPSKDIVKNLGGVFTIHMEDGTIPKVSPGAGRLLALLSLNALPRRLLFNFGDVFGKGFSYDSLGGTFTITRGNAYTKDFRLKSTIADVHVAGRIGLAQQDYDEVVKIDTSISSTLPVAGAIAGGPVTGVAVLLLTEIFKQPLKKATQLEYHVTGPWDDPQMQSTSKAKPETPKTKSADHS